MNIFILVVVSQELKPQLNIENTELKLPYFQKEVYNYSLKFIENISTITFYHFKKFCICFIMNQFYCFSYLHSFLFEVFLVK
jgi:hypothetical protein